MRKSKRPHKAVSKSAPTPAEGTAAAEFQDIRTQLFEAIGVIHAVQRSLLANEYVPGDSDTTRLQNALEVATRMIYAAASRLEPFEEPS